MQTTWGSRMQTPHLFSNARATATRIPHMQARTLLVEDRMVFTLFHAPAPPRLSDTILSNQRFTLA
jgi:hypothetical protein